MSEWMILVLIVSLVLALTLLFRWIGKSADTKSTLPFPTDAPRVGDVVRYEYDKEVIEERVHRRIGYDDGSYIIEFMNGDTLEVDGDKAFLGREIDVGVHDIPLPLIIRGS